MFRLMSMSGYKASADKNQAHGLCVPSAGTHHGRAVELDAVRHDWQIHHGVCAERLGGHHGIGDVAGESSERKEAGDKN